MFVAASTECFASLSLDAALSRLGDLEFTRVEIAINEHGNQLKPSQVHEDVDRTISVCRGDPHRLTPVAYSIELDAPEPLYYEQFASCCRLAKATKVVTLSVRASELGVPFNAEIERLRELVRIASVDGVLVGVKTEVGRVTQDPTTAAVLCEHVKGLGLTLDPSHYVVGPHRGANLDGLWKHVYHVHLRDTSKNDLQVRVGQGEIEYGRLVSQLSKVNYQRALSVQMFEQPDMDTFAELRKMRLLLESLL